MGTSESMLTATEAALLGLLQDAELSGYDMQKRVQHSVGYFWAPAKTRIYAALPRLVEAGLVKRRDIAQTTKPDKQLYRLTAKGRRALRRWLNEAPVDPPPDKNPMLLKLFFGEAADADALIAQVRERRAAAEQLLVELAAIDRRVAGGRHDFFPSLTRQWGYAWANALVEWADGVEQAIAARSSGDRAALTTHDKRVKRAGS